MTTGNRYGRVSRLELTAERAGAETVLSHAYARAPYRVMKPFSATRPGGSLRVMTMSSSAGIMAGDEQQVRVAVEAGASLTVTSQAFEKVHRMLGDAAARRDVVLTVGAGARLVFLQQPVIPYAGSRFATSTQVELADGSASLAYGEVLCCGRVARGERFQFDRFVNRVDVRVGGALAYADNTVLEPAGADYEGLGFFEGYTHLANGVLLGPDLDEERFADVRARLAERTWELGIIGGVTHLGSVGAHAADDVGAPRGWLVKLLGTRADELQALLAAIIDM